MVLLTYFTEDEAFSAMEEGIWRLPMDARFLKEIRPASDLRRSLSITETSFLVSSSSLSRVEMKIIINFLSFRWPRGDHMKN